MDYVISPLIIIIGVGLLGAVFTAWNFGRRRGNGLLGFLTGTGAGVLGSLIFMLPLNFCPFETERASAENGALTVGFGLLLVILSAGALIWVANRLVMGLTTSKPFAQGVGHSGLFKGTLTPYLLLLPTLTVLVLFLYNPFLDTFQLSTLLASRGRSRFICVDNFTSLIVDPSYHRSLLITFGFAIAIIVIGMSLSLLIATMAYQPVKGAKIYRTLLIWPYAISPVVSGVIFRLMFNPNGGIINYVTDSLLGTRFNWLSDPALAPWVVIATSVWTQMGFNILFYIAGLQNVPQDLLEAASIDGATAWQRFRRIMLPLLSPFTFFLLITNITYSFFDIFGAIDYLTEGGPLRATTVLIYNVYDTQRQNLGLGAAAAQSIVLFALVVTITAIQFRTSGRRVTYGA